MKRLTKREWDIVLDAVNELAAGEWDHSDQQAKQPDFAHIVDVLNDMRRRHVAILSTKELTLLNRGLSAGIMDDGIEHIGLTRREQKILGRVGNRLLDLAQSKMPRYYDDSTDKKAERMKPSAQHIKE